MNSAFRFFREWAPVAVAALCASGQLGAQLPENEALPPTSETISPEQHGLQLEKPLVPPEQNAEGGQDIIPLAPFAPIKPPQVEIVSPKNKAILPSRDIDIAVSLRDHTVSPDGEAIHVIMDNRAPIVVRDISRPVRFEALREGGHTVRVLATGANGVAFKNPEAFAMIHFYAKIEDFQGITDSRQPYITVNLPLAEAVSPDPRGWVRFDYILHNVAPPEREKYKVVFDINGRKGVITKTSPVYWSRMPPGRYKLVVELLDAQDLPVIGVLNRVEREFDVTDVLRADPLPPSSTGTRLEEQPHGP